MANAAPVVAVGAAIAVAAAVVVIAGGVGAAVVVATAEVVIRQIGVKNERGQVSHSNIHPEKFTFKPNAKNLRPPIYPTKANRTSVKTLGFATFLRFFCEYLQVECLNTLARATQ